MASEKFVQMWLPIIFIIAEAAMNFLPFLARERTYGFRYRLTVPRESDKPPQHEPKYANFPDLKQLFMSSSPPVDLECLDTSPFWSYIDLGPDLTLTAISANATVLASTMALGVISPEAIELLTHILIVNALCLTLITVSGTKKGTFWNFVTSNTVGLALISVTFYNLGGVLI